MGVEPIARLTSMSSGRPCVYVCGDARVLSRPVPSLHGIISPVFWDSRSRYRWCKIKIDAWRNQMNRQSRITKSDSICTVEKLRKHCLLPVVVLAVDSTVGGLLWTRRIAATDLNWVLPWMQIREQLGVRTTRGARHLSLEVVHVMKTSPTSGTLRTGPYMW